VFFIAFGFLQQGCFVCEGLLGGWGDAAEIGLPWVVRNQVLRLSTILLPPSDIIIAGHTVPCLILTCKSSVQLPPPGIIIARHLSLA
jgi:hypothetical protein